MMAARARLNRYSEPVMKPISKLTKAMSTSIGFSFVD